MCVLQRELRRIPSGLWKEQVAVQFHKSHDMIKYRKKAGCATSISKGCLFFLTDVCRLFMQF